MVTSSAAAANSYPLASYTFGTKEPKMEKDTSVADRLARMKVNYMKEGMRTSVEAIFADLAEAVSADELARYLDLKKLDERVYMFEAVSAYDGLGIKESVEWLVEVMERSKRTEMLRARAGVTGPASA